MPVGWPPGALPTGLREPLALARWQSCWGVAVQPRDTSARRRTVTRPPQRWRAGEGLALLRGKRWWREGGCPEHSSPAGPARGGSLSTQPAPAWGSLPWSLPPPGENLSLLHHLQAAPLGGSQPLCPWGAWPHPSHPRVPGKSEPAGTHHLAQGQCFPEGPSPHPVHLDKTPRKQPLSPCGTQWGGRVNDVLSPLTPDGCAATAP